MLKGRKRESFQLERAVQNKEDSQEGTDTLLGDVARYEETPERKQMSSPM
jgi:hypothetical protein